MASSASSSLNKIERAHQMYRDGQHGEALEFYTEALSMAKSKPQKIALHSNRAACFLKLHDFKKAAEECTLVLELDQRHTGALMLRAQTLVTLREYHSALFDVNRLMELNPSSDVYHNLHSRLKTQLSLAPIPESEEEIMMAEMEDLEELEEEGEIEDQPEYKKEEKGVEVEVQVEEPEELKEKLVGEGTASDGKSAETVPGLGVPATQIQTSKDLDTPHSQGWKAIPKPKGHSNLDYSRWDSVEDDSSDDEDSDEDDDEEESQPQYRFRLKTVGVRPVK
ncbi:hypothetical protein MKW94_023857 [Papaver nudicaule]|uniref:Uncharacterized protein n=1 Tax=Papaver nudicaule TaxID=74823 RepID=A0AA41SHS6_PAPNU|nr:hypothetical protein [Papaver nudicaule]